MVSYLRKCIYMDAPITIDFLLTPSQKDTIELRAQENGFDDIMSYIKVVALNTCAFTPKSVGRPAGEALEQYQLKMSPAQLEKLKTKMEASAMEDVSAYLQYVGLHAVVSAEIEVRSTGTLDAMLARISASKKA